MDSTADVFADIAAVLAAQATSLTGAIAIAGALIIGVVAIQVVWFKFGPSIIKKLFSAGK